MQLAKVALVHLILKGERESDLATVIVGDRHTLKPTAIDGTWYQEFTQLLFEKVGVNGIEDALGQLAVIDFNYDRCFEQVLLHALTGLYNLPRDRAGELLMEEARIFHPYGTIGALHDGPGQCLKAPVCEFGGDPIHRYSELSKGIRTFSERMSDTGILDEMRKEIAEAATIVFLGCAFHAQNMELLKVPKAGPKLIFGTTYQMSSADNAHVQARLQAMFSGTGASGAVGSSDIKMEDLKCGEFLRQYRRTLSAD